MITVPNVRKLAAAILVSALALTATPAPLSANNQQVAQPPSSPPSATHKYADWAGLWIGVEGLFVFISLTELGTYELEMMGETPDMKDNIRVVGRDAEGGISFERDGAPHLLRAATGEETCLKWLADRKNCLMVQESEGFCR